MLGRQHHERRAEQRVRTGGEHLDRAGLAGEPDQRALGPADPVALHQLDGLGPVQGLEVAEQPLGVGGDAHHPLAQVALEHREVAALAAPVGGDLLVGQHRAQARAPVHRRVRQVGQPVGVDHASTRLLVELAPRQTAGHRAGAGRQLGLQLGHRSRPVLLVVVPRVVDLQEDPLGPPVELDVGRGDAATRVVGQAQPAQLSAHRRDVGLGGDLGVLAGLHGVLLGRQAERVVAQGVQHVVAGHPLEAAVHVGRDVAQRVPDVQPDARRVREHVEHVGLGPARHPRRGRPAVPTGSGPRTSPPAPTGPASAPRSRPPAPPCSGRASPGPRRRHRPGGGLCRSSSRVSGRPRVRT